jgi:hypothetical protein
MDVRRIRNQHRRPLTRWLESRRRRRGSWLDRDLRARRRQLLRTRWRELACALGAFAVSGALIAALVRHWPFLVGVVVGAYLGAVTVLLLVLLAIADGSPDMTLAERHDDVLVISLRNGHAWRPQLAGLEPTLDEATAQAAASELLAYRRQRTDYELAHGR